MKKKIIRLVVPICLILVLGVLLVGCASSPGTPAPALPTLMDRVAALESLSKTNSTTQTDLTARIKTLEDLVKSMPSSVTLQTITNQLATNQSAVTQLQGTVSTLQSQQGQNSAIPQMQTDINNVKSDLNATKSQSATSNTDIQSLKQQVSDLQSKVAKLENPPTPTATSSTTSVTTGSTSTYAGVVATLLANTLAWNGTPLMSIGVSAPTGGIVRRINFTSFGSGYTSLPAINVDPPTTENGTTAKAIITGTIDATGTLSACKITVTDQGSGYTSEPDVAISSGNATASVNSWTAMSPFTSTNSFQLTLKNNNPTGTAGNIQLAVGLAIVDSNGNPLGSIPAYVTPGVDLTLSSNSFGTGWVYQSVISPSTIIFTNNYANSIFTSGINVAAGQSTTITAYMTLTNNNPDIDGQTLYIYPMIRILGYTAQ